MSQYSENSLAKDNENTAWMQVLDHIEDNWKILDIGCSSGNLGEELIKTKRATVDGIELDPGDAAIASKKLRHVEQLNIESDQIDKRFEGSYDAILLIDVIEHLVSPSLALKKLKALLKPSGVIIFSIPNMAHISVRLALLAGDFTYTKTGLLDKTHLHFYTGQEVQRVFTEAGCKITKFGCSSLQYPSSLQDKKLNQLGLKVSNKEAYHSMLKETQANVYQYVGEARFVKTGLIQPAIPTENAHEKDFKIIDEMLADHKKHAKHLQKSIELKDDHIRNLDKIIEDLRNRSIPARIKKRLKSH